MIRNGPRKLTDGKIVMREITRADSEDLYRWRMAETTLEKFLSTEVVPFEKHQDFVDRYFSEDNDDTWFIIEMDDSPVGSAALYYLPTAPDRCELGRIVIDPAHHGVRGFRLCQRAVRLLTELERGDVYAEIMADNRVMLAVAASCGFIPVSEGQHHGRRFKKLVFTPDTRTAHHE